MYGLSALTPLSAGAALLRATKTRAPVGAGAGSYAGSYCANVLYEPPYAPDRGLRAWVYAPAAEPEGGLGSTHRPEAGVWGLWLRQRRESTLFFGVWTTFVIM